MNMYVPLSISMVLHRLLLSGYVFACDRCVGIVVCMCVLVGCTLVCMCEHNMYTWFMPILLILVCMCKYNIPGLFNISLYM